jgi:hypothetical protein
MTWIKVTVFETLSAPGDSEMQADGRDAVLLSRRAAKVKACPIPARKSGFA